MRNGGPDLLLKARVVIVVARGRTDLYDYLRKGFTSVPDVEVIVDQRIPEPQEADGLGMLTLGSHWQPDLYDELTLRGFIIKRLE